MRVPVSIGRTTSLRRRCGAWLCAALLCVSLASGCGEASSTQYHESPRVGKNSDSLQPKTTDEPATDPKAQNESGKKDDRGSSEKPVVAPAATPATENVQAKSEPVKTEPATPLPVSPASDKNDGNKPTDDTAPVVAQKPSPKGIPSPAQGPQLSIDTTSGPPRKAEVLVKERKFKVEGPERAVRVSYDDIDLLKVLNMEPVTPEALKMMPDWMKSLDGKRVRLRGFMFPPYQETGLTGFAFARDNEVCCFVRKPKVYDVFEVRLRDGETTDYIQGRPFDVVGVFHIREKTEDWDIYGMYRVDDARVIDK